MTSRLIRTVSLALLSVAACDGGPSTGDDAGGHDVAPGLDASRAPDASVVPDAALTDGALPVPDAAPRDGSVATDPLDPSFAPAVDTNPASYPANVWVTSSLAKVQPNGMPGAVHWALIASARNEFESFQVHVRATSAPVQLTVTVSDLTDARSGGRLPAATNVLVSREHYMNITTLSDANGTRGMVPDGLIPTRDPLRHEARNAFPAMVPAGETRSAWIDVFVPSDAASGYYTGTVTVTDGARTLATLPVQLKVWDFALPSTATLKSAFGLGWNATCVQAYGGYNACGAYPGANGDPDRGVELSHVDNATLFLDYRVTLGGVVYAGPSDNNWTRFDSTYGPLMNGSAMTRLPGAALTAMWYTGSTSDAAALGRWQSHFTANSWLQRLQAYYCDEPPTAPCTWAVTTSRAQGIRTAAPNMDTLLTVDFARAQMHGLLDLVDTMTPVVDAIEPRGMPTTRPMYDGWLANPRKHVWWYQSCDEHQSCTDGVAGPVESTWPSYMIDASPVRNRIFQWQAYLYRIDGEIYYATDLCWTQSCGGGNDPWVSQYAFGGNGDGTLFYPGTPARIGGSTTVPLPSIRLVHIRDGMEDYEYLQALDAAGDSAFAQATARTFITNTYTFDNDPARMAAAREALGARLHHRAHP